MLYLRKIMAGVIVMFYFVLGFGLLLYSMNSASKDIQQQEIKGAKNKFDDLYRKYGEKYEIDPELLKAHAIVESGENPDAVGPTNDYGLMQVVYPQSLPGVVGWANASKERLLQDVDFNIDVAAQIMRWNHSKYPFKKAIAVYNSWGARLDNDDGPFRNQSYVDRVSNAYVGLLGSNYFGLERESSL